MPDIYEIIIGASTAAMAADIAFVLGVLYGN